EPERPHGRPQAAEPTGPHREGEEPKPMMHGHEKSDSAIVAMKPPNKAGRPGSGGGGAKGGGQGEREPMPHVPDTVPGKRVTDAGARTEGRGQPSNIRGGSRMQESCPYGSVRGAPSNGCPYRNRQIVSGSAPVRPNGVGSTGPTQGRPAGIVDLGRTSDHQLASDTAYIHLEIEPLHRRAREMPRQTARDGSAADELVGHEEVDVKDRIDLGCGHIRPAEAERRHTLLHRPEHETRFLAHRLGRLVAAPNDAPFIAGPPSRASPRPAATKLRAALFALGTV